ncbi:nuclear transport factor 2 family protein [Flavobacterium sp. MFBS3-15]|uniref:nuclear transport factor 2 family protein n=1 Tax=Flavobacterium sp. MFBS3-15 TaxID=2989816 RepID=UPI0022365AEA|nr:nuclear transport factor 2 family protein [Flavobacterium sp. MFBS3-15]MCW4467992.1 nuclear transport factor 2 family protein [Flavobacterium sp. MFBS3-15]
MKKIAVMAFSLFAVQVQAQEADIRKTISTFFEGLHTGDTLKIKSVCSDKMILQSIIENSKGTKFNYEDVSECYKSIASIPKDMKIEERLLDYRIQDDSSMAHAWIPYEFYINGKLSHSGVNSFQLYNDNGVWKIVYIIDTRRKPIK